nr:reverse transcriptase domain-containing protein [Tanacetum cinerariifolium]
ESPLPPVVSPTAESPRYVDESDPEEDPKEYEEDETEDGPVGYPMDGGDDGDDDDDIDSSGYDADNEDEEEEEEEEYLTPADSATTSISLLPEAEVKGLLAMPTPPPSPLTSQSPPSAGEHLARCMAPTVLPSPPLPPSLYPPPPIDRRDEAVPEMASTTLEKVNTRVTKLAELHEHDTQDLYALLEDAQDGRTRISQQAEFLALCGQLRRAGQPGRDARVPNHQDAPRDADSPEAFAMTWGVLKKKMMDKYCPQGELKKLEIELWNLKVKGNDVSTYTNHFQELTLICTKFIADENEKIDKYISGLPDNIYGNVKSSKPRTLDETIELTNDLMDQKLHTYAERAYNKRKTDDTSRNNHGHQ